MIDNKISKALSVILVFGVCCNVLCNVVYDIWQIPNVWYIGNSIAFVCYSWVLNKIIGSTLTIFILALCISQLLDELFGSPTQLDLVEYGSFIILAIYLKTKKKR